MRKKLCAFLLAFCMVLSLLPATAWAVEESAGTDGTTIEDNDGNQEPGDGNKEPGGDEEDENPPTSSWDYTYADGTLTIRGSGVVGTLPDDFAYQNSVNEVKFVEVDGSFTEINGTFSGFKRLVTLNIPEGVTSIAPNTFEGCLNLAWVGIPRSLSREALKNIIQNCPQLTTAGPKGIGGWFSIYYAWTDEIPDNFFSDWTTLKAVTLPDTITKIGKDAFKGCANLTDVYYTGSKLQWDRVEDHDQLVSDKITIHYGKYDLTVKGGTGGGSYAAGATVTITATATPNGQVFNQWTAKEGSNVNFTDANSTNTTFTMPENDVEIEATYIAAPETTHRLTVKNGTGEGNYPARAVITITADEMESKIFEMWTSSNGGVFADADKSQTAFTMPDSDVTVTAHYTDEEETYTLTVTGGTGGGSYAAGAEVTITANATPEGKVFDKWTSNNGGSFANASSTNTTFTMPAADVTVTANYKDAPSTAYTLTVTGGTGGGSYAAGAVVSITANATPEGKVFDKWTSNKGGSFASDTSASTTFTMPADNVTVTATYKDAPSANPTDPTDPTTPSDPTQPTGPVYGIFISNGWGGTVSAPAQSTAGSYVSFSATPNWGYELESIAVRDAAGNIILLNWVDGQYRFYMPASHVTIYADFAYSGTQNSSASTPANLALSPKPIVSRPADPTLPPLTIGAFNSGSASTGGLTYSVDFILSANAAGGTGGYSYQFEIMQNGRLTRTSGWTTNNMFLGKLSGSGTCTAKITVKDSSGRTTSTTVDLCKANSIQVK